MFQLTVNFCTCLLILACACIGNQTPLSAVQLLWVNLIMDSLGSLALSTDPPYEELLQRQPQNKNESIINGIMWKHIIVQSLAQLAILLFIFIYGPNFIKEENAARVGINKTILHCYGKLPGNKKDVNKILFGISSYWSSADWLLKGMDEAQCGKYAEKKDLSAAFKYYISSNGGTVHSTIIFNIFVIYTLFNQINSRIIDDSINIFKRIHRNFLFSAILILELVFQALIIFYGSVAFKVAKNGLTLFQWIVCIIFCLCTFVFDFILKILPLEKCCACCSKKRINGNVALSNIDIKKENIEKIQNKIWELSDDKLIKDDDLL